MNEMTEIRDWYLDTFPDDELGQDLVPGVTFMDLFEALDAYQDIYALLFGDPMGGDSLIRERVFAALAEIMDVPYEEIYDQWMMESKKQEVKENKMGNTVFAVMYTVCVGNDPANENGNVLVAVTDNLETAEQIKDSLDVEFPFIEKMTLNEVNMPNAGFDEGYAKEAYMEADGYERQIEDHRRADLDFVESMLEQFYEKSLLTFEGLSEDSIPDALEYFVEEKGETDAYANIFSGEQFNKVFRLSGDNAYPEDLVIVVFENTGSVVAMFIGARWLDDIVDNNAEREGYHPFNSLFFGDDRDE